jgi:hypothetical protein
MKTENITATKEVLAVAGIKVRNIVKVSAVLVIVVSLFTLSLAKPARTQLDPIGGYVIIQDNRVSGEIFVPQRDPDATHYVEHWVLYSNYIYPGSSDPNMLTTISVGRRSYENEADFFANVPWGSGFRYVRVDCTDTDRLPGR